MKVAVVTILWCSDSEDSLHHWQVIQLFVVGIFRTIYLFTYKLVNYCVIVVVSENKDVERKRDLFAVTNLLYCS